LKRDYPERPIVGVGAVVWRNDRVLLIRRGNPPRQGEWSLPGGAQDLGETVYAAAIREVHEETGIEITVTGLIDVIDSIDRDENGGFRYHYTLIDVLGEYVSGDARAGHDAADAGWFSLTEAVAMVNWPETRRILEKSVMLRALHRNKAKNQ
jgi:8-oxo-dGTP diphosphatase